MELQVYRTMWGIEDDWHTSFPRIKARGYRGVETAAPLPERRTLFQELRQEYDLGWIAHIYTQGRTVQEHIASFRHLYEDTLTLGPDFINTQSGRDAWSDDEASTFLSATIEIEQAHGVAVAHEIHRSRILYNPWTTARMLDRLPGLKVCADYSHWVCVSERLLDDVTDILRQTAERTIHIHARVGYEEGPQVPDPRAPEYARHLAAHERWWDWVWDAQEAAGKTHTTLAPEFGPPGYLHTLPYTNVPVADLQEICEWQTDRQRERFAARSASAT